MDKIIEKNTKEADLLPSTGITPIGSEQVKKFSEILRKYQSGRNTTEARIKASEEWWKLHNTKEEQKVSNIGKDGGRVSRSGWLHNTIASKHADAIEAYPEPVLLPREASDKHEAQTLTSIVPCILEQNGFEATYNDVAWQKLKTGTGAYKVIWDAKKNNGIGDIAIERVNLLNLYFEPGITDIQKSRYVFHTELVDTDVLKELYPELENQIGGDAYITSQFTLDDAVDNTDKSTVVEVYYHKYIGDKKTLQYCKYVGDTVLYATENIPEIAERGLYDHGKFPYELDALFPVEGSPYGYGLVDLCKDAQTDIDALNTTFIKNAMVGAMPRYFKRKGGDFNETDFLDLSKPIVEVNDISDLALRVIDYKSIDGAYLNVLEHKIQELRETSGNTETSTGTAPASMAASGIAALQEASGKGSRDSTKGSYRTFANVVTLIIELMRQFYTLPRKFRILGGNGAMEFVEYKNTGLLEQEDGRLPVFDIKVSAQKKNLYTKNAQNELVLQLYNLGFFRPDMVDQALLCLSLMEFDGKDEMVQKISKQGTMYQKLIQYMQLALTFAKAVRPDMVQGLHDDIMRTLGASGMVANGMSMNLPEVKLNDGTADEHSIVKKARERSQNASQPQGGGAII